MRTENTETFLMWHSSIWLKNKEKIKGTSQTKATTPSLSHLPFPCLYLTPVNLCQWFVRSAECATTAAPESPNALSWENTAGCSWDWLCWCFEKGFTQEKRTGRLWETQKKMMVMTVPDLQLGKHRLFWAACCAQYTSCSTDRVISVWNYRKKQHHGKQVNNWCTNIIQVCWKWQRINLYNLIAGFKKASNFRYRTAVVKCLGCFYRNLIGDIGSKNIKTFTGGKNAIKHRVLKSNMELFWVEMFQQCGPSVLIGIKCCKRKSLFLI